MTHSIPTAESDQDYFADKPNFPTKLITFTLLIGAFFGYLNETLLNVALTHLMHEFAVDKTTVQWMTTGFLLVMGAFTPITANVIQWFSTRIMLISTLTIFTIGTLICAVAPHFSLLLTGRFIQAISAAFTVPILFNTILLIYPPSKRGTIMGIITMMFMVAPAIGPTLSGIIVDNLGWRYLFLLTVPFILLSIFLAMRFITMNLQPITRPKIDLLSAILSVFGLGGLIYAASNFTHLPLSGFLTLFIGAIIAIALFLHRQTKLATPLIDLGVFRIAQYRYAMHILAILMFVFIGTELIIPMYAQQIVGLSGTLTGLILLPGSIMQALLSPVMGNQLDRQGAKPIVLPGSLLLLSVFILMFTFYQTNSTPSLLTAIFTLLPIAMSMILVAETHGLNALPKALYPHGTAIISTINPISGALGASFFVGITHIGEQLSDNLSPQLAMLNGVKGAFGVAIFAALIIFILALKLSKPR